MKSLLRTLFIGMLFFFSAIQGWAQNISNEGTDFWAVFPSHDPSGSNLANMNIFVTSKSNSEVTVTCGAYAETQLIPANTVVKFSIPRANSYIDATASNRISTDKGIHIVVSANQPPVAVYSHVYAGFRSAATLILPSRALGQKYYSMNYTQDNGGKNFLAIVAVEDNTVLQLKKLNGEIVPITLPRAGDVYQYMPPNRDDITGVSVEVDPVSSRCKRFAAFSGSTSLVIGCTSTRDPLFQQLYSVNSWGKVYAVTPFFGRKHIIRILAQENNTRITINGNIVVLNKGEFHQTQGMAEEVLIVSDKLVSVAEYALSQACTSATNATALGDADMVLLNPVEFSIKKITLFSSDQQAITEKYVNVAMKTAKTSSFKINGATPQNEIWRVFASNPEYSYIQIRVTLESLTLTADVGFNAIAYGFGNAESYAYSAGTSLASTQYLTFTNPSTNRQSSDICVNQNADFKVTLPYVLGKIVWKFDDGTAEYEELNPNATQTTVNGETFYDYKYPFDKSYSSLGRRQITAVGYFATDANSCFGSQADFIFEFDVEPLPTASFSSVAGSCPDQEISFTNTSSSNLLNRGIDSWLWDFGDGSPTSSLENPTHTYISAGTYMVKLIVSTETGCASNAVSQAVTVFPEMQPAFTTEGVACAQTNIIFKDQSTIGVGGTISKWRWDMGDGSAQLEKLNNQIFTYRYSLPGVYTVKLFLISSDGCMSRTVERTITVNHLPIADFTLPDFCIADGSAVFNNRSTINSNEQLTYLWDFGDPNANTQRPNTSTAINGVHVYTQTGLYEVTLTVKSAAGCIVTLKKQFTVNGSIPKAKMEIVNQDALCSNMPVVFIDKATVDFEQITKIEWFFDFANKTTADIVDEQPNLRTASAKEYTFKYPTFSNLPSKTYVVKMKAYSGRSCVSEEIKNITIYPEAVVDFALLSSCLTDGKANFSNLSSYTVANTNLTYSWNFGDQNANAQNPNTSTDKVPFHKYAQVGRYNVSLTVTTPFGCAKTVVKEIVIDGVLPIADFSVKNDSKLCVQNLISFDDKANLAFGEITRIDWYYDFANNPTQVESDLNPGSRATRKTYAHQYPVFTYPFSKVYTVRMVAYSGNSCVSEIQKTITINALPDLDFGLPITTCQEVASLNLVAKEKNNMPGSGIFTGSGVDGRGVFIPSKAGVGAHTIKYIFTTINGCTAEKTQTITVNETPVVNAGEDKTVLEDGQIALSASAFGSGLTYKWSPSVGLSRDDVLNPTVSPKEDMIYTLTVTSASGCIATDEVSVKYLKNLIVPTAFTPNSDGVNDLWNIQYIDNYPAVKVEIYDRTGQRIFLSQGYRNPFDGTYNGKNLPVGVYYYIINLNTTKKPITGALTIIR